MLRRAFSASNSIVSNFDAKNIQQELLKSYLRKTSNLFLCHNNPQLAEKVGQVVGGQLLDPNKTVFEASPGSGILTEQLLKHGTPKVRVFEHIDSRLTALKALKRKYGNRLEIVDKQILDLCSGHYKLLNLSREDVIRCCFEGIPVQKNWSNKCDHEDEQADSSVQFFCVLSPFLAREFLSFLVYSLAHYDSYFNTGPTEFFLFVPVSQYKQMLSKPSRNLKMYTAFTIHINTLFDYTDIDLYSADLEGVEQVKIENKPHTVVSSNHFSYTNGRAFKTQENFVFIRIKPKSIVNKLDGEFLINFVTFVKQSFIKRSNYAIRYYEKHFPGCAVDLIGLGISYFKTLGDLTYDEMFTIFNHLYQTPQYQTSIFKELC